MNIFKTIWNSKTFETISEVNYEVLKGVGYVIKGTAEIMCGVMEVMCDVAEGMCERSAEISQRKSSIENETYEYWKGLNCMEQQDYGELYRYDDREQMAKSVAEIARKENRSFTNKYDQY
jgi:hypothetical protein